MIINSPHRIGGWLLIYVIWTALAIFAALGINLHKFLTVNLGSSELNAFFYLTLILTMAWYILYAVRLYALMKLKKGAVKKILFMIIGTPIINTLILVLTAFAITLFNPEISFGESLGNIFGKETVLNLGCAFVIAFACFTYFRFSDRVKQIANYC